MKPSQTKNLGMITARVIKASNDLLNDPMNDYAGFTSDPTPILEKMVQEEGFSNLTHFAKVVERRTSGRWAYLNLCGI